MTRNICITAVDGHTGFTIAELILKYRDFSRKIDSLVGLTLDPDAKRAKDIAALGAKLVKHVPGRLRNVTKSLKDTGCDTICVIPPAHKNKFAISEELVAAAKKAKVPNVCLISSAGCDYADPRRQPRLREFIDLETIVLEAKSDAATETGASPCVIRWVYGTGLGRNGLAYLFRAGFYAENLLLYAPQAKEEAVLPLPIGTRHKFAPVALGVIPSTR